MATREMHTRNAQIYTYATLYYVFVEKRKKTSSIMRNLSYPLAMLLLSMLTALSIMMVGLNMLEIVFDWKALPAESDDVRSACILLTLLTLCL